MDAQEPIANLDKHSKSTSTTGMTREVGTICSTPRSQLPTNDKCVMVGTTGIAALKAKYGDDFSNFEIIQDVGYSSESSTHLSSDDIGDCIHVYSYTPPRRTDSSSFALKSVLRMNEDHDKPGDSLQKGYGSSSLGSSASHNDSGFGTIDNPSFDDADLNVDMCVKNIDDVIDAGVSDDDWEDYIDFSFIFADYKEDVSPLTETPTEDFDSDVSDDFMNRSSFTCDAQLFYKMISVDSDTGDLDSPDRDNSTTWTENETELNGNILDNEENVRVPSSSDEPNTVSQEMFSIDTKPNLNETPTRNWNQNHELPWDRSDANLDSDLTDGFALDISPGRHCSSPLRHSYRSVRYKHHSTSQNRVWTHREKHRKKLHDGKTNPKNHPSRRVQDWLTHHQKRPDISLDPISWRPRSGMDSPDESEERGRVPAPKLHEVDSSCDASGEYTTTAESDADSSIVSSSEDNGLEFSPMTRSPVGSVETVVPHGIELRSTGSSGEPVLLLPPPPPPTPHISSTESVSDLSSTAEQRQRHAALKCSSESRLNLVAGGMYQDRIVHCSTGGNSNQRPLALTTSMSSWLPSKVSDPEGTSHRQKKHSRSLPSVLLQSDSLQSSTSDHCQSQPSPRTKSFSSSLSKRSNRSKRRARRTSSSSNRSQNPVRRRRPTSTETSMRKRHWSQTQMTARDKGLQAVPVGTPANSTHGRVCNKYVLPSPESDIVLRHLEEQSTVSDQVWDGYQEMPYLSEAYSEPTVDEDAVRKLTEFGDDYGAVIGLPLFPRLDSTRTQPSTPSPSSSSSAAFIPDSPVNVMKGTVPVPEAYPLDSDSDVEDLYSVLEDSSKALQYAKCSFKQILNDAETAELNATCETHLTCLQSIQEHVASIEDGDTIFAEDYVRQLHGLIEEWVLLSEKIQVSQMLEPLKQSILKLHNKLLDLSVLAVLDHKSVSSFDDIPRVIEQLKVALSSLYDVKTFELLDLNLQVHRYVTHSEVRSPALKDEVTKLYRLRDDVHEQNFELLTKFYAIANNLQVYRKKYDHLSTKLDGLTKTADATHNADETNDPRGLEADLQDLRREEESLRSALEEYDLRYVIEEEVKALEDRFSACVSFGPDTSSGESRSPTSESASQAKSVEDEDGSPTRSIEGRSSRFWRVVRIALPIQVSLVVLCCLAIVLEPRCCAFLNNMNFSFIPQLRYYKGPPPV